ncbi:outer membrane beta-barrel protein [uncultured Mailhella sp.]|uniref:outer membrane protein n=1 Tax=uncultured Mailhella sp. TaxID=1981031 RepID=UPI0025E05EFF|nr:outer membrane beta-barrel protein [uncultured Mailhella sp.]
MKKFCLAAVLALLMALPCAARAADSGIYVVPKFVAGFQSTDWNVSTPGGSGSKDSTRGIAGFSIAGGYDFSVLYGAPLRAEIEYGYNSRIDKSVPFGEAESRLQTLMVNGYWDITNIMDFTPYVGAGVGLLFANTRGSADVNGQHFGSSDTDIKLAAQVGLGCSYFFTPNISADLGYRYLFSGDSETGYNGYSLRAESLSMHQFSLGLRVTF